MEYTSLSQGDLRSITAHRLRELEVHHFQFSLEENEEPGRSPERTSALADLERRISDYRAVLGLTESMEGESPERGSDGA